MQIKSPSMIAVPDAESEPWRPSFPASSVREIDLLSLWRIKHDIKSAVQKYGNFKYGNGIVFRMGSDAVVKRGEPLSVQPSEAAAMEYVAQHQHTTIPVPRARDVFKTGTRTWIVMDYVDGTPLDEVWHKLSQAERMSCMRELKGYVDQLRALPPPYPERVQAVDGGSSFDQRLYPYSAWGPFNSIDAFNEFFGHKYAPERYPQYKDLFEKVAGRKWRIVLTHGDLGPHNILWREGRIVSIIDWSFSGWFPEYWEYTRTRAGTIGGVAESFWEMFRDVMDSYPDELDVEICLHRLFSRV